MPIVAVPFTEVDQNITRPAVLDVVRQVKSITGISEEIPVLYIGQGESRYQPGSTIDTGASPDTSGSIRMVTIEVDENYDPGFFAINAGHKPEQAPDFIDDRLGVMIKPIYSVSEFTVNFVYRTTSRSEALRWRNDAQFRASQMRDVNMHEITYSYMLPLPCMRLLKHVHDLREARAGYGDSFETYLTDHLTTRSTNTVSITGEHTRISVRETQMRVQGFFDFQAEPEKVEKNEEKASWEVRFVYRFSFSKPVLASMRYPVIVHNQLIDEVFLPEIPVDHEKYQARMAASTNALHYFEAQELQRRTVGDKTLQFHPPEDVWQPRQVPMYTRPFLSVLLGLESETFPLEILDLRETGDYLIDEDILAFIASGENQFVNKINSSLVQVSLLRNDMLVRHDRFSVGADLKIRLLEKPDLRSVYRVLISFCSDITKIDYRAVRRATRSPAALQKLVRLTCPSRGQIRSLLPYLDIEHLFMDLPNAGFSRQQIIDNIVSMKTVMNSYAEASRIDGVRTQYVGRIQAPTLGVEVPTQP